MAAAATTDTHLLQRLCLFLLIVVAFFAALAKRLKVPYPILLVLAGLAISFIPHVPRVPLSPNLIFLIILPPLLYIGAWQTNWRDFRRNLLSISMLATGLVAFTVLGVAFFADHFITALDFKSGFLLGAIVAATDAVAATSIASTLGLAPRITSVIEGESMLNDATGLLALEFGLALLLNGDPPSFAEGAGRLLWLIFGGVAVGIALGWIVAIIERYVEDGPLEMVVSLIVPYVAYIAGEELKASGVIAVVACGLFLARRSRDIHTPQARIEIGAAWKSLDFILNGIVFVLIGLQMPYVLEGIHEYSAGTLLLYGLTFSVVLILLRMAWVFPGAFVSYWVRRHLFHRDIPRPEPRAIFVVGWTGMRGVLALAAAFSLPETLGDGRPFAQRNLILFLTYSTILVTLVGQGLSLPPLIRWLGLDGNREAEQEEKGARRFVLEQAVNHLRKVREDVEGDKQHQVDDLIHVYQHRLDAATHALRASHGSELTVQAARHEWHAKLISDTLAVERATLLQMLDEGKIGDEVLRRLQRKLDLTETRNVTAE